MKNLILFLLTFSFISCELHEQNAFLKGNESNSVFELKTIEKMFSAISNDDYFGLKKMISSQEIDLNIQNEQGQLLLNEAIKLKRDLITVLLVENGADPEAQDNEERSARDIIKDIENFETWEKILNGEGLDKEFLNSKVIKLISEGAEDQQSLLIQKLKIYFEAGADVNARNKRKYTLLILASSKGLADVVTFLCETEGVEINAKAGRYTALSLTKKLIRRNPKLANIIDILLSHGAQ